MLKESDAKNKWGIVGHSKIIDYLSKSIKSGKIAHAYLFTGPQGVGKRTMASWYIKSLICEVKDPYSCQSSCQPCKMFDLRSYSDINIVEREFNDKTGKIKKNISIEQIRKLQERLNLSSFSSNHYKFAMIDESDTLSLEAANALLKTLEEPSGKTIIILLAQSKARLPLTIVSRCQIINFLPVSTKEIFSYLVEKKVERKKAIFLSNNSFGCPGIAIEMLNSSEQYQELLRNIKQFIDLLNSGVINQFKLVGSMVSAMDVDGVKNILSLWGILIRDMILINNQMSSLISSPSLLIDLEKVSQQFDNRKLINMTNNINKSKIYLEANSNPRLTLENLVLNF